MPDFWTLLYCISLVIAALTIILGVYAGINCSKCIKILPNALRLHMIYCYYIFVILHCVLTIIICVAYFITNNQTHYTILYLRLIIVFPCQFLRNYFFTVVFERIIATVLLEKYRISYNTSLFVALLMCSQIITIVFVGYFYYGSFFATTILPMFNFGVFIFHVSTIVIFLVLYFLNRRMYKITAYRVTLKKRHQIYENNKVLSFLFIPILTFTFLAPIGPLITLIGFLYKLPSMPYCILHIFYNLPLGIIFLRQILSNKCKYVNSKTRSVLTVKSTLGKNVAIKSDTETYFQKLNLQWK